MGLGAHTLFLVGQEGIARRAVLRGSFTSTFRGNFEAAPHSFTTVLSVYEHCVFVSFRTLHICLR